ARPPPTPRSSPFQRPPPPLRPPTPHPHPLPRRPLRHPGHHRHHPRPHLIRPLHRLLKSLPEKGVIPKSPSRSVTSTPSLAVIAPSPWSVISTGAVASFIVCCVVERPPHFAFALT